MASGDPLVTFMALSGLPDANGTPCELGENNGHGIAIFDDTTNESIIFSGVLPGSYSGGGLTLELHYAMAAAVSGDIDWDAEIEANADGGTDTDADSFAAANSVDNTTVPGTAGVVDVVQITFTDGADMDSLAAGDKFRLRVTRDAASDTATGDAELHAVHIKET